MTREGRIDAPWTPEQVAALNAFQGRGDFHPFTCPADGTNGSSRHSDSRILVATTERWECPWCEYVQHWAHDYMAESFDSDPATSDAESASPSRPLRPESDG